MGKYWKSVAERAWRETRAEVRLDTIVRIATGIIAPIMAGLVVGCVTGHVAWGGMVTVAIVILIGAGVFVVKLAVVPAAMAAELQSHVTKQQDTQRINEISRRNSLVQACCKLYRASCDGISPAMMAGQELPPEDWLNNQLRERGESFRVQVSGYNWQTYDA